MKTFSAPFRSSWFRPETAWTSCYGSLHLLPNSTKTASRQFSRTLTESLMSVCRKITLSSSFLAIALLGSHWRALDIGIHSSWSGWQYMEKSWVTPILLVGGLRSGQRPEFQALHHLSTHHSSFATLSRSTSAYQLILRIIDQMIVDTQLLLKAS
jgi:hypothetical protein